MGTGAVWPQTRRHVCSTGLCRQCHHAFGVCSAAPVSRPVCPTEPFPPRVTVLSPRLWYCPCPQPPPRAPRDHHPAPPSTQRHPNISTPPSLRRDTGSSHSLRSWGSRCQPRGCRDTGHWAVPSVPVPSLPALVCSHKGLLLLHPQPSPLAGPGAATLLACPSSSALAGRVGVSRRSMCPSILHSSAGCSPTALLINCPLLLLLWECWALGCWGCLHPAPRTLPLPAPCPPCTGALSHTG